MWAEMGISRPTAHKWIRRWRAEGEAGLHDRSSKPRTTPHPSTVHRILTRHGLNLLAWPDRPTGAIVRRYERARPGELVHVDIKKLGNIPDGDADHVRHHPQEDRALPAADQRQGRTLQPHPAGRVGLPAALPDERRADPGPGRLPSHLQPPPVPHRTGRTPAHQPRQQRCGSIHLARQADKISHEARGETDELGAQGDEEGDAGAVARFLAPRSGPMSGTGTTPPGAPADCLRTHNHLAAPCHYPHRGLARRTAPPRRQKPTRPRPRRRPHPTRPRLPLALRSRLASSSWTVWAKVRRWGLRVAPGVRPSAVINCCWPGARTGQVVSRR